MSTVPKCPPTLLCPHCHPTTHEWGHQDKPTQGTPHQTPTEDTGPPLGGFASPRMSQWLGATGLWWQAVAVAGCPLCPQWDPPQMGPPTPDRPRCRRQSALALLPVKMVAPVLLRLWVLAGE